MIEQKYKLPNGNILIWFGNQPIHNCENVLVLSNGDVLFLQTVRQESSEDIKNDITKLNDTKFLNKYGWPSNSSGHDLYYELKEFFTNISAD